MNWSKQQPPAGQWAAPTDQGSTPQPGPGSGGQPGGWGSGWAQPPAAAKPGIIPLRPLGVGEILDGAVSTMRAHWRTVLGISLAVAVFTQTVATVTTGIWFREATSMQALENNPQPTPSQALDAVSGTLSSSGVTGLISLLGTIVATAMLTIVVSRAVLGSSVSVGEAWRASRQQLPRLFGLLVLLPLLLVTVVAVGLAPGLIMARAGQSIGGAALALLGGLAAVVAATWLWIRYSLAAPALMLEKQGVIASMRRSAKLVRGAWWRIFGIQLLTVLLIFFVSAVIETPTSVAAVIVGGDNAMEWISGQASGTSWSFLIIIGVGAVISSTITFPISAGVTALLYMDQRIRREALDLELARAAGLQGYDRPPFGPGEHHDTTPGS